MLAHYLWQAVDVDGDVSDEVNRTLSEVDFEEEAKQVSTIIYENRVHIMCMIYTLIPRLFLHYMQ